MNEKYKAILFDMDGTLLPMDMEAFTIGYFEDLWKKLIPFGFELKEFSSLIWAGTKEMAKNDGSRTNEETFWTFFDSRSDIKKSDINSHCLDYYTHEFNEAIRFTKENPLAVRAVELAHKKAEKVILATNPFFPMCGQHTRLKWVGLSPKDFDYISAYEDSHYCKPNPNYFLEVCERNNLDPKDCLMVGNDETEDMYTAARVGMDGYLVTDTVIRREEHPWSGKSGTFAELVKFLETL